MSRLDFTDQTTLIVPGTFVTLSSGDLRQVETILGRDGYFWATDSDGEDEEYHYNEISTIEVM